MDIAGEARRKAGICPESEVGATGVPPRLLCFFADWYMLSVPLCRVFFPASPAVSVWNIASHGRWKRAQTVIFS